MSPTKNIALLSFQVRDLRVYINKYKIEEVK